MTRRDRLAVFGSRATVPHTKPLLSVRMAVDFLSLLWPAASGRATPWSPGGLRKSAARTVQGVAVVLLVLHTAPP